MVVRKVILKVFFWSVGIILLPLQAHAQEYDLKFRNINLNHGLSNNCITHFEKSHNGFMWIATTSGVNKYDGYELKLLEGKTEEEKSIGSEIANCLFVDSKNNLWIGTMGSGLIRYNEKNDSFHRFSEDTLSKSSTNSNYIFDIAEDKSGLLWIAGGSGLDSYNPSSNHFKHYEHDASNTNTVSGDNIFCLEFVNNTELWIGTYGAGISILNTTNDSFTKYNSTNSKLNDNHILDIHKDKDGFVWIATEKGGLNLFNPHTRTFSSFMKEKGSYNFMDNSFPADIKEDKEGRIWISTDRGGLYYFDKNSNSFHNYIHNPGHKESLSSNALSRLYVDEKNFLWIGTYDLGVCLTNLDQKNLVHITQIDNTQRSISDKNVNTIFQDSKNNIWVGTEMGLNKTDPNFSSFEKFTINEGLSDNVFLCVEELSNGNIWMGTYTGGINIYNPSKNSFTNIRHNPNDSNSISSDFIRKIYEDSKGLVWIGTVRGGVDLYKPQTKTFKNYPNTHKQHIYLTSSNIMSILEDQNTNMWFATYGGGINVYDRSQDTFIYYKHNPKDDNTLSSNQVICQHLDSKQQLWVGTNAGLNKFNPIDSSFTRYYTEDGLPNNSIMSIIEDANKNLWISTGNGLSIYNLDNKTFTNIFKEDGLQENVFLYNSACLLDDGKIAFGGINGFSLLDTKKSYKKKTPPKVHFTNVSIFNVKIDGGISDDGRRIYNTPLHKAQELNLKHRDKLFTLQYSTLEFKTHKQIYYQYKIEELHNDWINLRNENNLSFHNLSPGDYLLKIRSYIPGTTICGETTELKINIQPPLYGNKYFISSLIIVFLIVAWALQHIRTINSQRQKAQLQNLVKEQTKELKKANEDLEEHRNNLETIVAKRTADLIKAKNKAEKADALKTSFLANMSHEIRTPMNAILGFVQLLNTPENSETENNYYKGLVQSNSLTLLQLIDDIMDLARIESGNFTIKKHGFNFTNEINDICAIYTEKILNQNPKVKFIFDKKEDPIIIYSDPLRLKQIIVNLINNAQKFTEEGKIELNYFLTDDDKLFCTIKDSGIGIPDKEIEHIFNRFRKLDRGTDKVYRGTGLGLAITRELIKLLDGEIHVDSKIGEGSTFSFTISTK